MRGYSDSTLMHMTKSDLLRQLRIAERNEQAAKATLNQQYENVKDWQPVLHGHWTKYMSSGSQCSMCGCDAPLYIDDENGHTVTELRSNYCPYCGAKMDEEVTNHE